MYVCIYLSIMMLKIKIIIQTWQLKRKRLNFTKIGQAQFQSFIFPTTKKIKGVSKTLVGGWDKRDSTLEEE